MYLGVALVRRARKMTRLIHCNAMFLAFSFRNPKAYKRLAPDPTCIWVPGRQDAAIKSAGDIGRNADLVPSDCLVMPGKSETGRSHAFCWARWGAGLDFERHTARLAGENPAVAPFEATYSAGTSNWGSFHPKNCVRLKKRSLRHYAKADARKRLRFQGHGNA